MILEGAKLKWFFLGFFSFFALGILAITIPNHFADESCDNTDSILGLNLEHHSLIYGVILLCCCIVMFPVMLVLNICCGSRYKTDDEMNNFITAVMIFAFFLYMVWDIVWMIAGGLILFRSNIECITSGSIMSIYSLINWSINIIFIIIFIIIGIRYRFCKSTPAFDYMTI